MLRKERSIDSVNPSPVYPSDLYIEAWLDLKDDRNTAFSRFYKIYSLKKYQYKSFEILINIDDTDIIVTQHTKTQVGVVENQKKISEQYFT